MATEDKVKTRPKYRKSGINFSSSEGKGTRGIDFNIPSPDMRGGGTPVQGNTNFNWQNFADPSMYGSSMSPAVGGTPQGFNFNTSSMDFNGNTPTGLGGTNFGSMNLQTPNMSTDFGGFSTPGFSGSDVPDKPFSLSDWGSKNKDLIAGGVGIANSLANAYFGWKNMGLAKDQFNFQKDSWNKNFANQVITTNNQLEEQARKRYSNSPTSNMTPEEYMAKHGVK